MAILAFAFPFFPGALGSDFTSFTFKLSAVDDVIWNSNEGPRGAAEDATLRVASEEGPVEKAVTPSMMATTRKTEAMILLFMVVDIDMVLGMILQSTTIHKSVLCYRFRWWMVVE